MVHKVRSLPQNVNFASDDYLKTYELRTDFSEINSNPLLSNVLTSAAVTTVRNRQNVLSGTVAPENLYIIVLWY